MDPTNDLGRGAADTASQTATNMASSLPSVLQDLKGSLNQIFAKDNPLVAQRTTQLGNYLSAGDQARAEYLPSHSGFAFSPTELNAMVSARQASALAPLAGTNQMLNSQYGGLTDYLSNAKDLFSAAVQAAQSNAARLQAAYAANAAAAGNNEVVEANGHKYLVNKMTGQKIADLGSATSGTGGAGMDFASILAAMNGGNQTGTTDWANYHTPNTVEGPTRADFTPPTRPAWDTTLQSSSLLSGIGSAWNGLFGPSTNTGTLINGSTPLNISGNGLGNIKL